MIQFKLFCVKFANLPITDTLLVMSSGGYVMRKDAYINVVVWIFIVGALVVAWLLDSELGKGEAFAVSMFCGLLFVFLQIWNFCFSESKDW